MSTIQLESAILYLEWNASLSLLAANEPEGYLRDHRGQIVATDENGDGHVVLGRFGAVYVDIDAAAANTDLSIYNLFDADQRTFEFYEVMYTPDGELNKVLANLLGDELGLGNVLILDRLEILPEFRKRGLGLVAMRAIIERLSPGAFAVAIKPFPLQFEASPPDDGRPDRWRERLALEQLGSNETVATRKLIDHYGKLGFVRLNRTQFMFTSTAWQLPKPNELMPGVL